jgi:hypothetical protein
MAEMVCSDGEAELACAGGDGGTRRRRDAEKEDRGEAAGVCSGGGGWRCVAKCGDGRAILMVKKNHFRF